TDASVNQPTTSAITWVVVLVNRVTVPPAPTGTMTRFGIVCPVTTLRFEEEPRAVGPPVGTTWTNPGPRGNVAVTFIATADTPAVGTPPRPVTWSGIADPAKSGSPPVVEPSPVRVSSRRLGATSWKRPADDVAAGTK